MKLVGIEWFKGIKDIERKWVNKQTKGKTLICVLRTPKYVKLIFDKDYYESFGEGIFRRRISKFVRGIYFKEAKP